MVATSNKRADIKTRQAADAELLLEAMHDLLDEHNCTVSLTALGTAVVEVLQRLPPHVRLTVARGWSERLLHVLQLTMPESQQLPGDAAGRLN
jgi:hypothetical protein